ncbi:MAG: hypothetical protein ABIJ41_07990 [Candidatus Omnitrophota bacterium]
MSFAQKIDKFNQSSKEVFESGKFSETKKRAWAEYHLLLFKTGVSVLPQTMNFLKEYNVELKKDSSHLIWSKIMAFAITEMRYTIRVDLNEHESKEFIQTVTQLYFGLFPEDAEVLEEYTKRKPELENSKPSLIFWRQLSRLSGRSNPFTPQSISSIILAISSLEMEITDYSLKAVLDDLKNNVAKALSDLQSVLKSE